MIVVDPKNLTKYVCVYKVSGKHVDYLNTKTDDVWLNTVL
jgi:hypothetical protein